MQNLLKELIIDFQKSKLFTGIERDLKYNIIKNKAFTCIGVRRSGKSTLLYQIIDKLLNKGINIENILYINFFDDRLIEIKRDKLNLILEAYFSLYPEKKNKDKIYCFFDEIQETDNWELFIDRIIRTEKTEIYITGSSAKMLSKEIATQMRGRSLVWELFPFSFNEFIRYKNIKELKNIRGTSKYRFIMQKYFKEYFISGGFPEVLDLSDKLRIMIHQEYYKAIIHRDIIERFDVIHPQTIKLLSHRLLYSVSSLYTINRLTEYLKSIGYKLSKTFVSNAIDWFEDTYFLFTVKKYDKSISKQNVNPKKIYCIDHSLVNSIISFKNNSRGYMLENMVFVELRRKFNNIFYYRTKNSQEIDFLYFDNKDRKKLLQVCYTLKDDKAKSREINSIVEAMKELRLKKSMIVTFEEEDVIKIKDKIIEIIPAWKFLLR